MVSTVAGSGNSGSQNGITSAAEFSNPRSLAFNSSGQLFIADTGNSQIRKID
jgi:secreted PhoX family phosphatase